MPRPRRCAALLAMALALPLAGAACSSGEPSLSPFGGSPGTPVGEAGSPDDASPRDDAAPREAGAEDASRPPDDAGSAPRVEPPFGDSSRGTGGAAGQQGAVLQAGSTTYRLNVPAAYSPARPAPLLVVFSGTEGGATMARNLQGAAPSTGTDGFVEAVLDGVVYRGNGAAGAAVLDAVRAAYNIDNDRTYLLGESAGTTAALELGLRLRQSTFAAYWANDVNARGTPASDATKLGFRPFGQAGPGGDLPDAEAIVAGMRTAGYRLDPVAPYAGPGSTTHGAPEQFLAALRWFSGKTRR